MKRWCVHCDADPTHLRNGLCRLCGNYRRKYGRLPDRETLVRRWQQRDERRLARRFDPVI